MDDKHVVNVRIDTENCRAITLQKNTPVDENATHSDGKSTEPYRQRVDGHAKSGANFKSIEFWPVENPRETERVIQLRFNEVRWRKRIGWCFGCIFHLLMHPISNS